MSTSNSGGTARPMAVLMSGLWAASSSATTTRATLRPGSQASTTCPWMSRLSMRRKEITWALGPPTRSGRYRSALTAFSGRDVAPGGRVADQLRREADVALGVGVERLGELVQRQVLLPERGRLHEHRKIHPGQNLDVRLLAEEQRLLAGRASEEVSQHQNALAVIELLHRGAHLRTNGLRRGARLD